MRGVAHLKKIHFWKALTGGGALSMGHSSEEIQ